MDEVNRRQLHRERLTTKRNRTRVINRIKGLLAGSGMRMALHGDVVTQLDAVRQWDGTPLPAALCARLKREWQKVYGLTEQIGGLEAERRTALRTNEERGLEQVRQWAALRGIGGQEYLVLCDGIVCAARFADAKTGGGMSWPHAGALPEWPGLPGTWDDEGWEWLYADDGHRDCPGLGALAAPEHAHAVVSGAAWPGECAPPENRDCGVGSVWL